MALLEASGIGKNFGDTHVLKDISLTLEQGEALAIIGSSGSGKTTLLRCLNFLERPDTGVIKVNGETMWDAADPATQRESEVRKKRLHFGLVFQNFNLFRNMTVRQNVLEGLITARGVDRAEAEQTADEMLEKVGFCFLFAQKYHAAMKYVGGIRKELGFRTVFNILGPLTNPANPDYFLLGVYDGYLVEPVAKVLDKLGVRNALVVYGEDRHS